MSTITHRIEKALEAKGITKTAFAGQIGVSRDTVYNWTDENIKFSVLMKICRVLDLDILDFISLSPEYLPGNLVADPQEKYTKGKKTVIKLRPHDQVCIRPDRRTVEIIHEN